MKPEEALRIIGDWISEETRKRKYDKVTVIELSDSLITLKEALEKQIPKKPNTNFYGDGSIETVCPECEANIEDLGDEYSGCPYCLQKIDWSDPKHD